jgi:predicted DNA binding CopG/RHH family protein
MNEMNKFIQQCLKLKSHDVIKILEDYRTLGSTPQIREDKSILISIKIPESLLKEFKSACSQKNIKYQTQIKNLMREWLK